MIFDINFTNYYESFFFEKKKETDEYSLVYTARMSVSYLTFDERLIW